MLSRNHIPLWIGLAMGLAIASPILGDTAEPKPRFSLFEFRVAALGIYQASNNWAVAGSGAWAPKIRLYDDVYVRANLGVFPLKNSDTPSRNFLVLDGQVLLGFPIDKGALELGGGAQSWGGGNGGLGPVISVNIVIPVPKFSPLDHFYLGYTSYFGSILNAQEFLIGMGVAF